ncbi:CocE/NonD family hydrolase [Leptolyngbya cf. ectocarpi LEGE 11479]|uniref:CocE/NonD family hydrolase n=1 Tax=Leptolyngbya cf. ectocarpi LEGE 11479 TaxID=1828722 RepID=A0A929F8B5_LEPEC|nr:CocE/NonD family hydrolase [Leptolyngbya ectocarpi]MBE9069200.1 CocE/NonD family hydrolase [Leptolyngbya cf. ectocarpi LEGE 11479]
MSSGVFSVKPKQVHSLLTRDGVRLDADVYAPDGVGPWPVLLMRQPYGRAIASTVVYAHPTWYAAHGYIVVIQDVRGRGTSEGSFDLFAHEVDDGYDSVQWAAELPGSNGQVGMYGFSYQGMTQLYAAQARPPALKALAPAMVGYDLYQDWAYENGALRLQAGLGWAIQLAAESARLKGDKTAFNALRAASRNLPLNGAVTAAPEVLKHYAPDSFWHDWVAHPQDDDYWQALKPDLVDVDVPMLHVGGWFDPYLTGDIRLFKEMAGRSQHPQHFWVGPWTHIPWSRKVGEVDFGPEAMNPIDRLQVQWFDYFLKGKGRLDQRAINVFEMGSHCWRRLDAWPAEGQTQTYYLRSSGLAGMRGDDGELVMSPAASSTGRDVLVHDPWRPVPALGGHVSWPGGSCDRTALDGRSDILTYTTPLLERDLAVAGEVVVSLKIQTDAASYDVCAILSVVQPDGRVFNLTQGYRRIFEASNASVSVPLQPTCFRLSAGQALRLSLSAACFPAYTVNPGTGADSLDTVPTIEHQIITLVIYQGDHTLLVLPLA